MKMPSVLCSAIKGLALSRRIRSYTELSEMMTFEERFRYLKLSGRVGKETFGQSRYMNQEFYHSDEWRHIRDIVIARDNGCDLGVPGYELHRRLCVHHMNPIAVQDLDYRSDLVCDPEYLITVSYATHQAIHYGDSDSLLVLHPGIRTPNDTCPWKSSS